MNEDIECKHCDKIIEVGERYHRHVTHNGSYLTIGPLCACCFDKTIGIEDEKK